MGNGMMRRSTSLATVKLQRRARLAEKLKEVFDVKEVTEVIAGSYSSTIDGFWLIFHFFRDAMLAFEISVYVSLHTYPRG